MTAALGQWAFPNAATPPGSSAYYSLRFENPRLRDRLALLFAWHAEVRGILTAVSDAGVARLKLDWWRDEIERTFAGQPRHPLALAMADQLDLPRLDREHFLDIAEHVEHQVRGLAGADRASIAAHLQGDRGALFALLAQCHQVDRKEHGRPQDQADHHSATALGRYCSMVRYLRDCGAKRPGPIPMGTRLPTEDLAAAGLGPAELPKADPTSSALLDGLASWIASHCPSAGEIRALPACLRAQARIHQALLRELRRSGPRILTARVELTALYKLWLAWRASR